MFKKIFTSLFIALAVGIQVLLTPFASADYLPVRAYANDTVAGYATLLKTSLIEPGQKVVFVIEKPDRSVIQIPAMADLDRVAVADLFGHQTKLAGTYKVALVYPGSSKSSPQESFQVYADVLSTTQSTLSVSDPMLVADGVTKTFVTVTLYDTYRNPISAHSVKLISSRSEDQIEVTNNGSSDSNGHAYFKVASVYPGISTLTALDNTTNTILKGREEVVFQAPIPLKKGIGGTTLTTNLLGADLLNSAKNDVLSGPVDHFDIEGLSATAKINTDLNVTVIARDKNGNVSKNYTGTILFSVPDDDNALLPGHGEYSFKESDQGQFVFNLALRFSKLGKQTLQVFDKDNWDIAGEQDLTVVPVEAVNPAVLTSNLTIKSPSDDSELGSTSVIVTGQGDANINLKVFDNDSKIGDSETDEDGFFSFDAKNLENGSHVFYVMSEGGEVSNSVHVAIDTVPPVLSLLSVYPDGVVKPGDPLSITVQSEPDLDEVKVRLQGIEAALLASDIPGTYTATVAAPALEGTFPLDVILVDKLSNKAELSGQATVQTGALKPKSPPAVDGLEGTSGDAQVTLNWQAVIGHDNPIQRYRLYYGAHYNELNQTFETQGAVTTLTLSGLENGKQLFFAVKAVDSKGIESDDFGVTIALTPAAPAVPALAQPAFVGYQAIPMDGAVQLSWPAFPGVHAFYYKIYFGVKSGQYDDFAVTSDYSPYFTVRDLINEVPYHFVIAALDINGYEISSLSPEFTATPSVNALKPSAPSFASPSYSKLSHVPTTGKTGPEAVWIVLISSFLAYFFYHHKRRFIKRG